MTEQKFSERDYKSALEYLRDEGCLDCGTALRHFGRISRDDLNNLQVDLCGHPVPIRVFCIALKHQFPNLFFQSAMSIGDLATAMDE